MKIEEASITKTPAPFVCNCTAVQSSNMAECSWFHILYLAPNRGVKYFTAGEPTTLKIGSYLNTYKLFFNKIINIHNALYDITKLPELKQ